jgi:regulator of protease activity HflC (stomatin/prohibitin superfamily)
MVIWLGSASRIFPPLSRRLSVTKEQTTVAANGWVMLPINLALLFGGGLLGLVGIALASAVGGLGVLLALAGFLAAFVGLIFLTGHFTLQPNEACVLTFFGPYIGTVRESGFYWANPFYGKRKISLRARNFEGTKLKVNDKQGNPIEIAAVVVWHVVNTAQAFFDVENYEDYVKVQSETAVRHLANKYAYDHGEENETTLRSGVDEVSVALRAELQERLIKAGVLVDEARLTHLAYAPEIASAMLRRQQAEAVIAARQKIVHGAVSMVQMALTELAQKQVVTLDEDRKAALVSNLLIVLCGEAEAQPVINTGTSQG